MRGAVDLALGALACIALWWRRRAPAAVAIVLALAAALIATAGVANMVALYFVARYRSLRVAVAIAVLDVLAGWAFWLLYPGNMALSLTLTVNLAIAAAVTAWGALLQSQTALVTAFRERAERAEEEKALREDWVRATERTRIAREMHDVAAHRISLVALYAGGLEVARTHQADDVRRAAALIRSSAVDALDELRTAIGVLREDEPRSLVQPGFDRIEDLVHDARAAGQDVALDLDLALKPTIRPGCRPRCLPDRPGGPDQCEKARAGRAGQRHGAADRRRRRDLCAEPVQWRMSLGVPGSSNGLIGLSERAALAGGTVEHGVGESGLFGLKAVLPWR